MITFCRLVIVTILFSVLTVPGLHAAERDTLYQYSTINSLLAGLYDGEMTVEALTAHGDFGLGTFNGLDGEMIVVDNIIYQARGGGAAMAATGDTGVPFSSVTFFDADKSVPLPAGFNLEALEAYVDQLAPNQNIYQAIRVDGLFQNVKLRTAPKQTKPYAPLADVIEQQEVFQLSDIAGTLVGIRTPAYLAGLNVPGYHFHFVTADRSKGGHVFGITAASGIIQIDHTAQFTVALPSSQQFAALDLGKTRQDDMQKVEKARSAPMSSAPSYAAPSYPTPRHSEPIPAPVYAPPPMPVSPVVAAPALPSVIVTPPAQPAAVKAAVPATDAALPVVEEKKSDAPWSFLFECEDNALPDNMRMRNQRHKAARRPAGKSTRCK